MRVLALTRYGPLGASSRVRMGQFVGPLAASGVEVEVRPLLPDAYVRQLYAGHRPSRALVARSYARRVRDLARAPSADGVWIEKELLPFVPASVERALLAGPPYVVDYDDATFHTYDSHPSPAVRRALGDKVARLMRAARVVVVGNPYLADYAARAGAGRVEVIPSVIDLDRYGPRADEPGGPFTIGWVGSPGSERLLDHVREPLAALVGEGARVVLVGASPDALGGVPHETRTWTEAGEVAEIGSFHVGIMPLADTPWERGKRGYKLVQCMGAGRPVVASPVGVNADVVVDGETGFLASSPDDWAGALRRLRASPELRASMGRAGRARVASRYSLAVAAPRLSALLRSAV